MALTMRLAMIFSMTRLPFGAGLVCDHLYPDFIHGVALYHTSTYILTLGWYVTMPTDPRSFYGYAHVYESVSCTSTRNMNTF